MTTLTRGISEYDVALSPPSTEADAEGSTTTDIVSSTTTSSSSPFEQQLQQQQQQEMINNGTTTTTTTTNNNTPSATTTNITVPEPPKWRFVNVAKKSFGYTSQHAGTHVEGKSNHDLGAKYVEPSSSDGSVSSRANEERTVSGGGEFDDAPVFRDFEKDYNNDEDVVGKGEFAGPAFGEFTKDQNQVGRLGERGARGTVESHGDDDDVGKLFVRELERNESDEAPSGKFKGLPRRNVVDPHSRAPFKEWEVDIELSPRTGRERVWYDGDDVDDTYVAPEMEGGNAGRGGVGRIGFRGDGTADETFVGSFPDGRRPERGGEGGESGTKTSDSEADSRGDPREGALFRYYGDESVAPSSRNDGVGGRAEDADDSDVVLMAKPSETARERRKRRRLHLLLLLLLVLVIVLGVLVGKKNDDERQEAAFVAATVLMEEAPVPIVVLANETNQTSAPSSRPSLPPSEDTDSPLFLPSIEELQPDTEGPTASPTSNLTTTPCPESSEELNLCLAVDMSGSVCNRGSSSDCTDCTHWMSSFLPFFFSSECRDDWVLEEACCENFASVKDFASALVASLGEDGGGPSSGGRFSIVQFATDAWPLSGPTSAEDALRVVRGLDYSGGGTNHAAAIEACRDTLPSPSASDLAPSSQRNVIVLVTDGVPSVPQYDPEGAAQAAARAAREEGTSIVPVFVSPYGNDESALEFMRRLGGDGGKVFDALGFDALEGLREELVESVSCARK